MGIPNTENIPEWAVYLAQDANGGWNWFEKKPSYSESNKKWSTPATCKTWHANIIDHNLFF
jgi:hypothetical protein